MHAIRRHVSHSSARAGGFFRKGTKQCSANKGQPAGWHSGEIIRTARRSTWESCIYNLQRVKIHGELKYSFLTTFFFLLNDLPISNWPPNHTLVHNIHTCLLLLLTVCVYECGLAINSTRRILYPWKGGSSEAQRAKRKKNKIKKAAALKYWASIRSNTALCKNSRCFM